MYWVIYCILWELFVIENSTSQQHASCRASLFITSNFMVPYIIWSNDRQPAYKSSKETSECVSRHISNMNYLCARYLLSKSDTSCASSDVYFLKQMQFIKIFVNIAYSIISQSSIESTSCALTGSFKIYLSGFRTLVHYLTHSLNNTFGFITPTCTAIPCLNVSMIASAQPENA